MATPLDPKQLVSFEELLTSQVVQQEALTRMLNAKGLFTKGEFLEMVRVVDGEMGWCTASSQVATGGKVAAVEQRKQELRRGILQFSPRKVEHAHFQVYAASTSTVEYRCRSRCASVDN